MALLEAVEGHGGLDPIADPGHWIDPRLPLSRHSRVVRACVVASFRCCSLDFHFIGHCQMASHQVEVDLKDLLVFLFKPGRSG